MPSQEWDALPFVGRRAEQEVVAALMSGPGGSVQFIGEPGAGKTRLLRSAHELAVAAGFPVLEVVADPLLTDRPLHALAAALPSTGTARGTLTTGDPSPVPWIATVATGGSSASIEAAVDTCETLAVHGGGLVVCVDDAQWLDAATVTALALLRRRVPSACLIVARRAVPDRADLDALTGEVHRLGPLDEEELASIARARLGADPGPRLRAELERAGGNPFLVHVLIDIVLADDRLGRDDGACEVADDGRGPVVPDLATVRRLLPAAGEVATLLELAAVLGPSFPVRALAVFSGRSVADLAGTLGQAMVGGLLVASGDRLAFAHDLIREAVLLGIPAPIRAALHAEAADAWTACGAPAAVVAHHLLAAGPEAGVASATALRAAARDAARDDPATAVRLLEQAVAVLPSGAPGRVELQADLAQALGLAGALEQAADLAGRALDDGPPAEVAQDLHRTIAHLRFVQGRFAEAAMLLQANHGGPGDAASVDLAYAKLLSFDLAGAAAVAAEAAEAAAAAGDEVVAATALCAGSYVAMVQGRTGDAVRLGRRAVTAADRSPRREAHHLQPTLFLGMAQALHDDADGADDTLRRSFELARRLGTAWDAPLRHGVVAAELYRLGRLDDCAAEAEAGLQLAEEQGLHLSSVLLHSHLALVHLHRGAAGAATDALVAAERSLADYGSRLGIHWLGLGRALLLESAGEFDAAATVLSQLVMLTVGMGMLGRHHLVAPHAVRVALAAGRRADAERAAAAADQLAERSDAPTVVAAAERCHALLDRNPDLALRALGRFDSARRPLERAQAAEDAAGLLRDAARRDEAAQWFDEALTFYDRVDAVHDAERVRAAAERPTRTTRPRRPSTGWGALTGSEQRVVSLVAQGLSNPEIAERLYVSRRTVETHLAHAFTKLGVGSRVELALAASKRDDAAPVT